MTDAEFLTGIEQMISDALDLGICPRPFEIIRERVDELIKLREYREPMRVLPYSLYAGKCPRCGVAFLDDSTNYCGNCGQSLKWGTR